MARQAKPIEPGGCRLRGGVVRGSEILCLLMFRAGGAKFGAERVVSSRPPPFSPPSRRLQLSWVVGTCGQTEIARHAACGRGKRHSALAREHNFTPRPVQLPCDGHLRSRPSRCAPSKPCEETSGAMLICRTQSISSRLRDAIRAASMSRSRAVPNRSSGLLSVVQLPNSETADPSTRQNM